jgi:hypothetical protein
MKEETTLFSCTQHKANIVLRKHLMKEGKGEGKEEHVDRTDSSPQHRKTGNEDLGSCPLGALPGHQLWGSLEKLTSSLWYILGPAAVVGGLALTSSLRWPCDVLLTLQSLRSLGFYFPDHPGNWCLCE